jgi:hypothetical protein
MRKERVQKGPARRCRQRYGRKLATTVLTLLMVTVQVAPEAVSHPVQPLKMERVSGVAVRVTTVFML